MFWDELKYDDKGLVCGVFQDYQTGEVLMVSWLNREAVQKTWESKRTYVYRRSKGRIMMKGEVSGNVQIVHEMIADCDRDALVIKIEQVGGAACAHGYRSCFFERITDEGMLQTEGEPLFDPAEVYGQK
ncbi:MAG: phosphoribosyl-AMP cyclohydrolase [Abitibacteriaceae bacterium]|nr:phosphoribosyl-AMP cyclohydrolase [Abditibacteriaceae bacterium]